MVNPQPEVDQMSVSQLKARIRELDKVIKRLTEATVNMSPLYKMKVGIPRIRHTTKIKEVVVAELKKRLNHISTIQD